MDVRGKAPVYIPPTYPAAPATATGTGVPAPTASERRIGLKIRTAFMLTLFFVVLQLHPVLNFFNAVARALFMRDDLANEYGCATGKGTLMVAVLFFILALLWLRPL